MSVLTGIWNSIVAIAPAVAHFACNLIQQGSDAVKF